MIFHYLVMLDTISYFFDKFNIIFLVKIMKYRYIEFSHYN